MQPVGYLELFQQLGGTSSELLTELELGQLGHDHVDGVLALGWR